MKDRGRHINQARAGNFAFDFESGGACDQNSFEAMSTAPFGFVCGFMFPNNQGWLVRVFREAGQGGEETIFAPPIQDQIRAFVGKGAVKKFVPAVDPINYRLAGTWILQLRQLLGDMGEKLLVVRW